MKNLNVREVEQFMVAGLRKHIQLDFCNLRMVREADLECCMYYHFRNFFKDDPSWKVLARKHSMHTGHFVDLLIFRGTVPQFAIELKWNAANMSLKDRQSLRRCVTELGVHKAYFITTRYSKKPFQKIVKIDGSEKHHIFELVISLPYIGEQMADWKAKRRKYTRHLEPRKRKRDAAKKVGLLRG
jgi:hypothetical protein